MNEILHHEVRENNQGLTPGHWFFHTGQWCLCAQAYKTANGLWTAEIQLASKGKDFSKVEFKTLTELKQQLSRYYGTDIIRGKLPKALDL
jgi:hypothetical protein